MLETLAAYKPRICYRLALLISCGTCAQQAVQIVSQSEQEGLPALRKQASAGRPGREFAFHGGEHGFDQGATMKYNLGLLLEKARLSRAMCGLLPRRMRPR